MSSLLFLLQSEPFWQRESFWAAVAALGGLASAVAAFLTIRQAARGRRDEARLKRAYLRVITTKMDCSQAELLKFPLKLVNVGEHPAADISGRILFINRDSDPPVILDRTIRLANDFAQQAEYIFNIPVPAVRAAVVPQQFIMLALRYRDAILGGTFEQFYYFTWDGCPGGSASEVVSHWGANRPDAEGFFDREIREFRLATQQAGPASTSAPRWGELQQCQRCPAILDAGAARCGDCGAETRAARMKTAAVVPIVIISILVLALVASYLLR
jgi:hypothetical protein